MTPERRIEVEVEVPVAPAEAWDAIATGPGITAWFMPAEVDGRVGGSIVHRHDGETESPGTITAYDPARRFAYQERGALDAEAGERAIATEFLIEARSGGTCIVRVVMSGFGDDEWDAAKESFGDGWRQALGALRLYLTHFPGERAATITAGGLLQASKDEVWARLAPALGLPREPARGARVTAGGDAAPALSGTVTQAHGTMLTLVLDEPARGLAFVGAGGPAEGEAYVFVRAQLFGANAAQAAARDQAAWRRWFASAPLAP